MLVITWCSVFASFVVFALFVHLSRASVEVCGPLIFTSVAQRSPANPEEWKDIYFGTLIPLDIGHLRSGN